MKLRQRCLILLSIMILTGVIYLPPSAHAQDLPEGRVEIVSVNTDLFPRIQLTFEAYDGGGNFLRGLQADDLQIVEGDATQNPEAVRPVEQLELLQPGLDVVVAVNFAPELNASYGGVRRFEAVLQRLREWMEADPSSGDRLSISTNSGLQLIRSTDRQEWLAVLENLGQVNPANEQADLTAIARALDLVTDIGGEEKPRSVVLVVTPLLPAASLDGIRTLIDRADRLNVPIFVWLTTSAQSIAANPDVFGALGDLAGITGGELSIFTGSEALPEIEGYLQRHRFQYRLEYESRLNFTATHPVSLRINLEDGGVLSAALPVYLNILPPNPIFLSPQSQIERKFFPPESPARDLEPDAVTYRVIVEFPDGYPRALRVSRFYVDGKLVQERTSAPFDTFTWPVEDVESDRQAEIQVEVEDVLGLTGQSIRLPVQVSVESLPPTVWQTALSGNRPLVLGAILFSGLLLGMVLLLAGRKNPKPPFSRDPRSRDPVTQPLPPPVKKQRGTINPASMARRLASPRPAATPIPSAPAWLIQVGEDGGQVLENEESTLNRRLLPLKRKETLLGSDPLRSQICLTSPSVSPVHARIVLNEAGEYWIFDQGSLAGTWVNYMPVGGGGMCLRHGDLIHIGFVTLRFEISKKPQPNPAIVRSYQEEG